MCVCVRAIYSCFEGGWRAGADISDGPSPGEASKKAETPEPLGTGFRV